MTNHLPPGAFYVCSPPPGFEWRLEFPTKSEVREGAAIAPVTRQRVDIKETGSFVRPQAPTPRPLVDVQPTPQTLDYLRREARWLEGERVEHAVALLLDASGDVCGCIRRSDQLPRSCGVDIPSLVREAGETPKARALLFLHNHTRADAFSESLGRHWHGACEPSAADIAFTRDLREALRAKGLTLCDHLICGPNALPYSFAESEKPMLSEWDLRVARMEARGY
jgi:hypothetical protein